MFNIVFILYFLSGFGFADAATEPGARPQPRAILGINIANGRETGGPVEGVTVFGVAPGGGADDAGLQLHDVIVEINDVSLMATSARDANRLLLDFMIGVSPGDELRVIYLRDGQANRTSLTAGELDPAMIVEPGLPFARDLERLSRQFGEEFIKPLKYRWRHHGLFAGMELVALTPELGRYFGTQDGLLVIRSPNNGKIDLQDGDVIREIGGRSPRDPGHAMRILRSYEPGEEVVIGIMRDQRDNDIAIQLPDPEADAQPEGE